MAEFICSDSSRIGRRPFEVVNESLPLENPQSHHRVDTRKAYLNHAVLDAPRALRHRDGTTVKRTMGPFIKLWLMNGVLLTMEFDSPEEASAWREQLKPVIAASSAVL